MAFLLSHTEASTHHATIGFMSMNHRVGQIVSNISPLLYMLILYVPS